MKTETFTDRETNSATGRSSHARKILWMLALIPIIHASAAFAQVTLSSPASDKTAGVGIIVNSQAGGVIVADLLPNSPAAASKLIHKGDSILAVAEGEEPSQSLGGKTLTEAVDMIRGSIGSNMRLTVASDGADEREVFLKRERLNLDSETPFDDDAAQPEVPPTPAPASPGLVFERLPGGEPDKLSNYRGKIVVLEIWATWCGPCQGAMADLQRTVAQSNELRGKVTFVTVSMDRRKEAPMARLKEKGWTDTLNGWAAHAALEPWKIQGLPTTYVIDADGQIIAGNPQMTQQMLEELIKPLLKN